MERAGTMQKTELVIRPASAEDIPRIADIESRLFGDPWTAEQFLSSIDSPTEIFLCAEYGGEIGGYICMTLIFDQAYIGNLAVDNIFRRRGIARAMVDEVCGIAKESGCPAVVLDVRTNNTEARKLYKSCGFTDAALRKNMYELPNEDGITMIKEL